MDRRPASAREGAVDARRSALEARQPLGDQREALDRVLGLEQLLALERLERQDLAEPPGDPRRVVEVGVAGAGQQVLDPLGRPAQERREQSVLGRNDDRRVVGQEGDATQGETVLADPTLEQPEAAPPDAADAKETVRDVVKSTIEASVPTGCGSAGTPASWPRAISSTPNGCPPAAQSRTSAT